MKVAIYGAGAFGTALGQILTDNGHTVSYYDPIKYPDESLSKVSGESEVNLLCTPSAAAPKLLLFLPHDKPLICASKGFITLASFQPFGQNFSVISGGAFAADLINKKESSLTATSDLAEKLFKTSWLSIDRTEDHLGTLLCATFKNIYAIGAGLWDLKYGTTDFDDFINTVLGEMRTVLIANGCDPNTTNLSCGLNDLVITCASPASRNFDFGTKLRADPLYGVKAQKGEIKIKTTEGLSAIEAIARTPSFSRPKNLPILDRIIDTVNNTLLPLPAQK